jgi:Tat protein secretion system quality control protein TatD with DNase activity
MLTIAETYGKPVSIHSRNSLDEILSLLSTFNLKKDAFIGLMDPHNN